MSDDELRRFGDLAQKLVDNGYAVLPVYWRGRR
jgi:hypothetical protein